MSLKAVLFDFNGVIIKDEAIRLQVIDEILIQENLQPQGVSKRQAIVGCSDGAYLQQILTTRGRIVSEAYLTGLLKRKAQAYVAKLETIEKLPLYPGVEDLIFQVRSRNLKLAIVSGALGPEIETVLTRAKLAEHFKVIVSGEDVATTKPEPDGYLLGVERLNLEYPGLNLQPQECLVIEDTPVSIEAAKRAQMQVVGVANTYPFHILQRCCNWTVDYLNDLEWERVQQAYTQKESQPSI